MLRDQDAPRDVMMAALWRKLEGKPWQAYRTTPGMGSSGYAFIRGPIGQPNERVFPVNSFDGPNGNAIELATVMNELQAKADLAEKVLGVPETDVLNHETSSSGWRWWFTCFLCGGQTNQGEETGASHKDDCPWKLYQEND